VISTDRLKDKFYKSDEHPYRMYERLIAEVLRAGDTLLDAGCGRSAPVLRKFLGRAAFLLGIDLEDGRHDLGRIRYVKGNILNIPIQENAVDVVISRSVLEHLERPRQAFEEIARVLKPGGHFIFLVPNLTDYGSILSLLIPNKFHPWIVSRTEGRAGQDVFLTYYRANTPSAIRRLGKETGFTVNQLSWLGQYPSYFMFSRPLFLVATAYEKLTGRCRWLRFLRGWLLVDLLKM